MRKHLCFLAFNVKEKKLAQVRGFTLSTKRLQELGLDPCKREEDEL